MQKFAVSLRKIAQSHGGIAGSAMIIAYLADCVAETAILGEKKCPV
jgi:hypothetical protein